MDFAWTDDQLRLKRSVAEFARRELNKDLAERERQNTFPIEGWKKCADFGIHGLPIPRAYGGTEQDPLTIMIALEGLGYGCRDNGLLFAINAQIWSVQMPILRFGSDGQKEAWLPGLAAGNLIGAHAMSEPGSGSDSFSLQTTAERSRDGYILNGSKTFVSNAPVADLFLVFATVSRKRGFMGVTAFLVERDRRGLTVGTPMDKMGLKTAPLAEVGLNDCEIPVENRLGAEGNGGAIFRYSMAWERGWILASCIGTMERQLETCVEYAKSRRQFGQPIGKFQSVSNRVIDMKVRLETARLLLYRVGWLRAQGHDAVGEAAMAKLYLSECFVQSSLDALQIHGGFGYMTESEIERDMRDSAASRIYSGTSEIQRGIVGRSLGL